MQTMHACYKKKASKSGCSFFHVQILFFIFFFLFLVCKFKVGWNLLRWQFLISDQSRDCFDLLVETLNSIDERLLVYSELKKKALRLREFSTDESLKPDWEVLSRVRTFAHVHGDNSPFSILFSPLDDAGTSLLTCAAWLSRDFSGR